MNIYYRTQGGYYYKKNGNKKTRVSSNEFKKNKKKNGGGFEKKKKKLKKGGSPDTEKVVPHDLFERFIFAYDGNFTQCKRCERLWYGTYNEGDEYKEGFSYAKVRLIGDISMPCVSQKDKDFYNPQKNQKNRFTL